MNIGDIVIEEVTDLGQDALDNPGKYKAMLGVSIRNPFFSKKTMRSYFKWASEQFKELIVLLMDDPDKYNRIALMDMDEESALETARNMADDTKKAYEKICRQLGVNNIRVVQFRDFIDNPEFIKFSAEVDRLYEENTAFRELVMQEMRKNVKEKVSNLNSEELSKAEKVLSNYMYEETIPLLYFTSKGYLIELDPHVELAIKRECYGGRLDNVRTELGLPQRGHIFARPSFVQYGHSSHQ